MTMFTALIAMLLSILVTPITMAQLSTFDNGSKAINTDLSKVVEPQADTNPLREGAYFPVKSPNNAETSNVLYQNKKIESFESAKDDVITLIKQVINYILSILGLVMLIGLIREGYKIVTNAEDSDQYKKAIGKVKTYGIALAGIAMSWFIVSFIFYVVDYMLTLRS